MISLGIIFALGALVSWAGGDFFIQRSTRQVGTIKALFFIAALGAIGYLPFVVKDLPLILVGNNLILLALTVVVTFFAAVFDFDALHDGKLAVVEPVLGLELPIIVLLSIVIRGERLTLPQSACIIVIIIGIMLVVTSKRLRWHKRLLLEKGFIYAGIGAVGMGLTSFLYAVSGQQNSPVLTVWFIHTALALVCLVIMSRRGVIGELPADLKKGWRPLLPMAIFDNLAWMFYAWAALYIPISIATALSESYIALALILGVVFNREKFRKHQYAGAILAIGALVVLAYLTPEL